MKTVIGGITGFFTGGPLGALAGGVGGADGEITAKKQKIAMKRAASADSGLALLQRRQLADADSERKKLLQEKAQIVGGSRRRPRGGGLAAYRSAY